jgi:hypothetical protein
LTGPRLHPPYPPPPAPRRTPLNSSRRARTTASTSVTGSTPPGGGTRTLPSGTPATRPFSTGSSPPSMVCCPPRRFRTTRIRAPSSSGSMAIYDLACRQWRTDRNKVEWWWILKSSPNKPLRHPTTDGTLDIFQYDAASEGGAAKVVHSSNVGGDQGRPKTCRTWRTRGTGSTC